MSDGLCMRKEGGLGVELDAETLPTFSVTHLTHPVTPVTFDLSNPLPACKINKNQETSHTLLSQLE